MSINKYEHAHDEINIKDNTYVTYTKTMNEGPVLFEPILSLQGIDNKIVTYYNEQDYVKEHGEPNLSITGQSAYHAKQWLAGGGILKTIRLSAVDAKRANSVLVLKLKLVDQQATTKGGEPLYIDSVTGGETILSTGNIPLMFQIAKVKLEVQIFDTVPDNEIDARSRLCNLYSKDEEKNEYVFPIAAVVSRGNGKYGNQFRYRFTINSNRDKQTDFRNYYLQIFKNENGGLVEVDNSPLTVSLNPDATFNNITQYASDVVNNEELPVYLYTVPEYFTELTNLLLPVLQQEDDEMVAENVDLLLFCTEKLDQYKYVEMDTDSVNVSALEGFGLKNGSDGEFDLANPKRQAAINERFMDLFEGKIDETILDKKQQKFDLALDANFPLEVKKSMRLWSEKRGEGDVPVIFDAGIIYTVDEVLSFLTEDTCFDSKNFKIITQSFDTKDPVNGKIIRVAGSYLIAAELCKHIIDPLRGNHVPFAGEDIKFDDYIIEGSLTPTYTTEEQKSDIVKARGNFIEKENGHYVFNSDVSTQLIESAMTNFNNTLVLHEIIHDLQLLGATMRHKKISALNDLSQINKMGETKIGKYAGVKIKEGEFNAYKDPNDPRNKTIRSKIKLVFDDYSQDNIFDIEIAKSN